MVYGKRKWSRVPAFATSGEGVALTGPALGFLKGSSARRGQTSAALWMNLQKLYELRLADQKASDTIKALPTLANCGNKQGSWQQRPLQSACEQRSSTLKCSAAKAEQVRPIRPFDARRRTI